MSIDNVPKGFSLSGNACNRAADPAQSAPSAEPRFVDGKCRYCGEPEEGHFPEMCGYDKCKGEACETWTYRTAKNIYDLCDVCLLKRTAQLERERSDLHEWQSSVRAKILHYYPHEVSIGKILEDKCAAETRAETAESALRQIVSFLEIMDARGGLGLDVHKRIDELLTVAAQTPEEKR